MSLFEETYQPMAKAQRVFEESPDDCGFGNRQGRHEGTPVISDGVHQELILLGDQFLGKKGPTVEGMFTEHALAPSVNG